MNNCKNCGSTAQFKRVLIQHAEDGILEVYECCGCGYTENIFYKFTYAEGKNAEGTLIFRTGEDLR